MDPQLKWLIKTAAATLTLVGLLDAGRKRGWLRPHKTVPSRLMNLRRGSRSRASRVRVAGGGDRSACSPRAGP